MEEMQEIAGSNPCHGVTPKTYQAPAQPPMAGRSPAESDVSHSQNSRLAQQDAMKPSLGGGKHGTVLGQTYVGFGLGVQQLEQRAFLRPRSLPGHAVDLGMLAWQTRRNHQ